MKNETLSLQQKDAKHHIHPFSDLQYQNNPSATRMISRAEGVYIYDNDGKKILDGMSGLWCVNMGYGNQSVHQAVNEQMQELIYYNTFFGTSHPPIVKLAEMIAEITPEHMNQVFFTGSGSEANDTMMRLVRHYWASKGLPDKFVIISRKNAYHGSTMAAASLGGMSAMHAQGGLPIPGIVHIDQPYHYEACVEAGGEVDRAEFGRRAAHALANKIDELGEEKVAAFIAEPIQGAGGVIIPPETYWPEVDRICKERNILLVADEVICGFGRTGEWFGSDYYKIKPDMMPFAKGVTSGYLPLGGLVVSDEVAGVLRDANVELAHGYTYSAHPTCAAAAIANIQLMHDTNIVERVKTEIGPYLAEKWQALGEHPLVGEARSLGMLAAIELVKDKESFVLYENAKEVSGICRDHCYDNGIVMRAVGNKMIIAPPLVCTNAEIDEMLDKILKSLDMTMATIT